MVTSQKVRSAELEGILVREKIQRALFKLGLTFAECRGIVDYDPAAETAYWSFNTQTGEESIRIGKKIGALPVKSIEMVLRHELLHRSLYHGFGEFYPNKTLSNIALDICINRLLFEIWPDEMTELSKAIYPEESLQTPIALCNCAAEPDQIVPKLRDFWEQIWRSAGEEGRLRPLNPASLYFRLMHYLPECEQCANLNPLPNHQHNGSQGESPGSQLPARLRRAYRKAAEQIQEGLGRRSGTGQALEEYSVEPAKLGDSELEAFLLRLPIRRKMDALASRITRPARPQPRTLPYPVRLSRKGMVFASVGLSDQLGLFWNEEPAEEPARLMISLYMDVSGSMIEKYPVVAYCADTLKEFPLKAYTFDTEIRDLSVEDITQGRIRGGGGTDFDALAEHMLDDKEVKTSVVFTDGQGDLSPDLARRLRKRGHRLYLVYLLDRDEKIPAGRLEQTAAESIRFVCRPETINHLTHALPE